jgi:hypothetical protein
MRHQPRKPVLARHPPGEIGVGKGSSYRKEALPKEIDTVAESYDIGTPRHVS